MQPGYPARVVLGSYVPAKMYIAFHAIGTIGLIGVGVLCLGASAVMLRRESNRDVFRSSMIFVLHMAFLLLAIFAYAMSAVQLAGLVTSAAHP